MKIIFLFLAVLFTGVIFCRLSYKQDVTAIHTLSWAIGVVGFVTMQFNLL